MSAQTTETMSERVIELAGEIIGVEKEKVSLDSSFSADLGYDSLDAVEFIMLVEDEFDIDVPDEERDNIITVRNAVEVIRKLTCAQSVWFYWARRPGNGV